MDSINRHYKCQGYTKNKYTHVALLILTTQSLLKMESMTKSKASSINQQTNVKAVEEGTC